MAGLGSCGAELSHALDAVLDHLTAKRASGARGHFGAPDQKPLLASLPCDPAKLALAARWRRETTLSLRAIAARVHLGTSKSASARLHQ
jgi:hypothetical protein